MSIFILGMDADTFEENGGQEHFDQARAIVGYSQQNSGAGWDPPKGGDQTRGALIDNLMSPTYKEFRNVMYDYHRGSLDEMSSDPKNGKLKLARAITQFKQMNSRRPNSFIMRVFFDAKADEIQESFLMDQM